MKHSGVFGGHMALGGVLVLQIEGGQAFTRQKYGGFIFRKFRCLMIKKPKPQTLFFLL